MLILYNGIIRTIARARHTVQAVAVENGKITAVGSDAEILALRGAGCRAINLCGRLALPGFHDSHTHLATTGAQAKKLDLSDAATVDDVIGRVKKHIENNGIRPGEWVEASGLDDTGFREPPGRVMFDKISPDHPIVISRHCRHTAYVNSMALKLALGEISSRAPKNTEACLDNGVFGLQINNNIKTGVLHEGDMDIVFKLLPRASVADIQQNILAASNCMLRHGITTVHSNDTSAGDIKYCQAFGNTGGIAINGSGIVGCDAGSEAGGGLNAAACDADDIAEGGSGAAFAAFRGLDGRLPLRVYEITTINSLEEARSFINSAEERPNTSFYTNRCVKLLLDGSLGARTAYLSKPYCDAPGNTGIKHYEQAELDEIIEYVDSAGWQLAFHAIGDGALGQILAGMARIKNVARNRHRIIHCQIGNDEQYKQIKEFGLCVDAQPAFVYSDAPIISSRVGPALAESSYAWRTLTRLGIPVGFGSDSPIEPFNPLWGIYCAVSRPGYKPGARDERMGVEEACYCYTAGAAHLAFKECESGRIAPGMYADIVVLDKDIFSAATDEINTAKPEIVIINGVVYELQ